LPHGLSRRRPVRPQHDDLGLGHGLFGARRSRTATGKHFVEELVNVFRVHIRLLLTAPRRGARRRRLLRSMTTPLGYPVDERDATDDQ
jgi:hypothetical protein